MLGRKGFPDAVIDDVLDRLQSVGLLDDESYAREVARACQDDRAMGSRAISLELRRRRIPSEIARRAVDSLDPVDQELAAERVVIASLRKSRGLEQPRRIQRALAAGGRKGFEPGRLSEIIRAVLESEGEEAPDLA